MSLYTNDSFGVAARDEALQYKLDNEVSNHMEKRYDPTDGHTYLYLISKTGKELSRVQLDGGSTVTYTITIGEHLHGTLSTSKSEACSGEVITVTATPDTGYELGNIMLDGEVITGTTFTMPARNVVVSATFNALSTDVAFYYGASTEIPTSREGLSVVQKQLATFISSDGFEQVIHTGAPGVGLQYGCFSFPLDFTLVDVSVGGLSVMANMVKVTHSEYNLYHYNSKTYQDTNYRFKFTKNS